jgi:hypothetical protein
VFPIFVSRTQHSRTRVGAQQQQDA